MVAVVIVVIIIAAAAIAGILFLGASFNSSRTTATESQLGPSNSQIVSSMIPAFMKDLNARDIEALSNFYSNTSVVLWSGIAAGLQGIYSGVNYIRILYVSSLSHMDRLSANASKINATSTGPNVTVTLTLAMIGHSTVLGNLTAKIDVTQVWGKIAGNWTIQNENWDYIAFATASQGSATVFPQWGLSLAGKNPDLAGEHMLEWNLAPYVALGIYGSIVVIAALALYMRVRRRSES
jgi:hypothetical protein